ncbi:VOC family protein [Novosphingobium sp. BL-52-GroH]|uniref:VOC family protein n=1 Tax=Novosphingobium sp. BL-52-GroH TaxID=3349877 RepID=UPI00384F3B2A
MTIDRLATVLQVDDLRDAVAAWRQVLGVEPSFVDGDRWAQFDVGTARLALAGCDRIDAPGVMLKVGDLDAEHARLAEAAPIARGAHERRFRLAMPSGAVAIFYQPL